MSLCCSLEVYVVFLKYRIASLYKEGTGNDSPYYTMLIAHAISPG